jgi:hypothetical protein
MPVSASSGQRRPGPQTSRLMAALGLAMAIPLITVGAPRAAGAPVPPGVKIATDGGIPSDAVAAVGFSSMHDNPWVEPETPAAAFAGTQLAMTDFVLTEFQPTGRDRRTGRLRGEIGVAPTGLPLSRAGSVTRIRLQQRVDDGWTVLGASTPTIVVDGPRPRQLGRSPMAVRGRTSGVKGTVEVTVQERHGEQARVLGRTVVHARRAAKGAPFRGSVCFAAPSRPSGWVVVTERPGTDPGLVIQATAVPIRFR